MPHDFRIQINVVGPFRVAGPGGEELTPRGRKACGLLAILALSSERQRPRTILQDKLWSDRGQDQAAASLRQTLSEIRKAFGPYRGCLLADHRSVALARDSVEIDLHGPPRIWRSSAGPATRPTLLEGLDVRDPEFEDWLREQRAAFERDFPLHDDEGAAARDRPPPAPATLEHVVADRPWIYIASLPDAPTGDDAFVARILAGSITAGVQEIGAVEVSTAIRDSPGIELRVEARSVGAGMLVQIALLDAHAQRVLWSGGQILPRGDVLPVEEAALQAAANHVIDIALIQLRRLAQGAEADSAFALGFDAVQRMFRIDPAELKVADAGLIAAFEQNPQGIFLAWRAYLRTFFMAEHRLDAQAQAEEARMLVHKALELEPYNSYVLALCSYVHSLLLYEYHAGHELAEQSVRYNPGNPLGVAYLARAKTYLGDFEGGYSLAAKARTLAGPSPYRYTLDFLGGVSAALSGRFEEAIALQEVSSALGPAYKAPLRYLLALYLKTGSHDQAREVFESLREAEPEFSMRLMRDRSYPTDGLRAAGLLDKIDEEFE